MEVRKNTPLKDVLKLSPACSCKECKHGCTMGSGFLGPDDKKKIAEFLSLGEKELEDARLEKATLFHQEHFRPKINRDGKPYGRCTFFTNEGTCAIHPVKPLQCKVTMGCKEYGPMLQQWFMLNVLVNPDDPESIRQYQQYLASGGKTIAGGKLSELVPDKHMLRKILRYDIL